MSTRKEAKKSDFVKPCDIMRDNQIIYPGEAGSPPHFRQERRSTMNVKQAGERIFEVLGMLDDKYRPEYREAAALLDDLLKELEATEQRNADLEKRSKSLQKRVWRREEKLEATERKLAEADRVVDAAEGLSIELDEWTNSNNIIGVLELKQALSDYEASKEYTSQEVG